MKILRDDLKKMCQQKFACCAIINVGTYDIINHVGSLPHESKQ